MGISNNMKISEVWKTLRKQWPKCGTTLPSAKKEPQRKGYYLSKSTTEIISKRIQRKTKVSSQ